MKTPEHASSLHLRHDHCDVVIVGSGKRTKKYHQKVCMSLKASGHINNFLLMPGRSKVASFASVKACLWIVVVPPKHRLLIYAKIIRSCFVFKKVRVLVETPASIADILLSFIPFFDVSILEVAKMDYNISAPNFTDSEHFYHDKRFGSDHAYAVYFRFMGFVRGVFFLTRGKVRLSRKKSDKEGITIGNSENNDTFFLTPLMREKNELDLLKVFYKESLTGKIRDKLTIPLINLLLKIYFFLFSVKV